MITDKYAALWPFLGICAEVIVLCAVIFIFERRRSKKMADEAENNEQNNSYANVNLKLLLDFLLIIIYIARKHVVNAKDSDVRNRK